MQEKLEAKSLNKPDEVRTFEKGKVELATVNNLTFGRLTLQPGWKWSTHVKPIAKTQSCQQPHTQLVLSGRLHVKMDDGKEWEAGPGDVAYVPPGHDGWVVGNEPVVAIDVTGMKDYAKAKK